MQRHLGTVRGFLQAHARRSRWFLLVQAVIGILFGLGLFDRVVMPLAVHHSADQKVPDLRGRTLADAQGRLRAAHLDVDEPIEVNDEIRPVGTIVAQDPDGGAYVRSGRRVKLLVSAGPAVRAIPDLTGKTARLATMELAQVGLATGITMTVPSSLMREGEIIGTRPARGERPQSGGKIDLLLSGGPPRGLYLMPDLRGRSLDEAERILNAAGVRVSRGGGGDRVQVQDPPPGSPIASGEAARID